MTHFPVYPLELYPFVYFQIFVNFWSIELVPSERWSQPAVRTEMLMEEEGEGEGEGKPLVVGAARYRDI